MTFHFAKLLPLPAITACIITGLSSLACAAEIKAPPRPPASDRVQVTPGAAPESFLKHKHRHKKEKRESKQDDKKGKGKAG